MSKPEPKEDGNIVLGADEYRYTPDYAHLSDHIVYIVISYPENDDYTPSNELVFETFDLAAKWIEKVCPGVEHVFFGYPRKTSWGTDISFPSQEIKYEIVRLVLVKDDES